MKTMLLRIGAKSRNRFIAFRRYSRQLYKKAHKAFFAACVSLSTTLMLTTPAFALIGGGGNSGGSRDIWGWLQTSLQDVYEKFLGVSTIAACVSASICLLMMNFSTDDRAVSSSRAWLKRIMLSWVILNVLGYIMAYLVNLTEGGKYTG